jgi:hypothetical protein
MSELMYKQTTGSLRKTLLTTVCGLALLPFVAKSTNANADDLDRPSVWVSLSGQAERIEGSPEIFNPPFLAQFDYLNLDPVLPLQHPARYAVGGAAAISIEPNGTDWVFTAAVRYGRSNGQKHVYQQVPPISYPYQVLFQPMKMKVQATLKHLNAAATNAETHAVVDFQVGRDFGLGIFGAKDDSVLALGVRFAQFSSRRSASLNGVPDFYHFGSQQKYGVGRSNHQYYGTLTTHNNFHGIGPSLSWNASHSVLGSEDDASVALDWGVNASVLFGRQKIEGDTSATWKHYTRYLRAVPFSAHYARVITYQQHPNIDRSHNVAVPNIGGFAGISLRYPNAKVSLGYRADFFFGAMDGGIAARKTYDRSFHGPFATISVGLGG